MNKVVLNAKGRNHIKFLPMKDTIQFEGEEADKLRKCEELFNRLQNSDDVERLFIQTNRKKGYMISVWKMDNLFYLVQSLKDENKMYINTVYILNSENDSINIAKFVVNNCETLMNDYKTQISEGFEAYKRFDFKVKE